MLVENIILVLSCLGVVQALLLCIYLFSLHDKRANIFLALLLLGLIILTVKSILNNYMYLAPWIRVLGISGNLVTGPFLWFYGKALFEKRDFVIKDLVHFIPFALFALLCWIIPNGADFQSYLIASLVFMHLAIYLVLCWYYIINNLGGARLLPWFRNIVLGVTIVWFMYVGIFIGFIPIYILGAVFFSLLIYLFSYLLLKRHVFALEKYNSSTIDPAASRQLFQQVKDLFESRELYLDSTISLKVVADALPAGPREVSQAINEHGGMNFSEFVNQYRIARAKMLLADPGSAHEKIESIAYDAGFGNVTSFNLAFKAATGLTPSRYRQQVSLG